MLITVNRPINYLMLIMVNIIFSINYVKCNYLMLIIVNIESIIKQ